MQQLVLWDLAAAAASCRKAQRLGLWLELYPELGLCEEGQPGPWADGQRACPLGKPSTLVYLPGYTRSARIASGLSTSSSYREL